MYLIFKFSQQLFEPLIHSKPTVIHVSAALPSLLINFFSPIEFEAKKRPVVSPYGRSRIANAALATSVHGSGEGALIRVEGKCPIAAERGNLRNELAFGENAFELSVRLLIP